MANTIIIKNSSTVSDVPTVGQLEQGELAINLLDEKLYSKNSSNLIFEITDHDNLTNYVANEHINVVTTGWTKTAGDIRMNDSLAIQFGTAGDVHVEWDATQLKFTGLANNQSIWFTNGMHLRLYDASDTGWFDMHHDDLDVVFSAAGATRYKLNTLPTRMVQAYIQESAGAAADYTGEGQIWIRDDAPNTPWFTGDTGVDLPLGYNAMPPVTISASQNFLLSQVGSMLHKSSGVAVTLTCAQDTDTWDGATWAVHNDDTEALTIAAGASVTVYWLEAGAAPAAGSVTVEQGGLVSVYKKSNTEFWVWGGKEAPAGSPSFDSLTSKTGGTGNYTTTGDFTADNFEATGLGPNTTPGTDDAYFGGYGIMGSRATFYVSNVAGDVAIGVDGVHNANVKLLAHTTGVTVTGALTATSFGGITSANLLDKSAVETVSGQWIFSALLTCSHGSFFLNERTSASTDSANYGQLWVKNNVPNDLYFTNDIGVDYPVAYATYRRSSASVLDNLDQTLDMTTDSVADAMVNGCWGKTTTTARTLTLEPSTDTQFPVGAQIAIWNRGASGNMTVTEGSGTTLYVLTGSATTDAAGSATIAPGGYATLIRESTTVYLLMGAGITP